MEIILKESTVNTFKLLGVFVSSDLSGGLSRYVYTKESREANVLY